MTKDQILEAFKMLASSQGYYSSVYNSLINKANGWDTFLTYLEEQQFTDVVDMIMFIEG